MKGNADLEIFSSRLLNAPVEQVYMAFARAELLSRWWGPKGFTNTFHEFDLRPGGKWVLTMHGPEKGNYENASVFNTVDPYKIVTWSRISQPVFDMEVGFERINESITRISFRMVFEKAKDCEKIRKFAEPKNEENFDRLEDILSKIS